MPEEPEVPIQADHLWAWFWSLHRRRRQTMGAVPHPFLHADLRAWEQWEDVRLTGTEKELLVRMDDALVSTWAELSARDRRLKASSQTQRRSPKQRGAIQ